MEFKAKLPKFLLSRKLYYALAAVAFVAILPLFVRSDYIVGHVITVMIIFAIYASSWNLLAYSGQGSLGHAAFLGIGGFASALLATRLGLPPIIGLFLGGLLSAGIGLLIGLACVRLKAWFLAMVTFGFSVIVVTIISQFDTVFGGMIGFPTIYNCSTSHSILLRHVSHSNSFNRGYFLGDEVQVRLGFQSYS